MKIWNINADGVLLGEAAAPKHPLWQPGCDFPEFVVPADAVEVRPPSTKKNEAAVFDRVSGTWRVVADHRGETWYALDRPVVVSVLGSPSAAGLTKSSAVFPMSDEERRLAALAVEDPVGAMAAQRRAFAAAALAAYVPLASKAE